MENLRQFRVHFNIEMLGPLAISGYGRVELWAADRAAASASVYASVANIFIYKIEYI